MNFDAARLAKLSGLAPLEDTGILAESKDHKKDLEETNEEKDSYVDEASVNEEDAVLFELSEDEHGDHEEMQQEQVDENVAQEPVIENSEVTTLSIDDLRETVLELRDEIIAEQAAEQQALAEAPIRRAIRNEIKALISDLPSDAADNWMYGRGGRPAAKDSKTHATALFGLGFKNSNN